MYGLDRPVKVRSCDCAGCTDAGDFRAPKSRDHLTDYYWFCLQHVRQYNSQWDYFAGLSPDAIEEHLRSATVWERPTWPMGGWKAREQAARDDIRREFFNEEATEPPPASAPMPQTERDALAALELTPPVTFAAVKLRYRELVKQHHPDANGGSLHAEEKFKIVNQAFTVLKGIYAMGAG